MSRSWGITRKHERENAPTPYRRSKYKHTQEEEAVPQVQIFVIIDEWTDNQGNTSSEVTHSKWFSSEDEAWEALSLIAESYGLVLPHDETSIRIEDTLMVDEYRIEELTRG